MDIQIEMFNAIALRDYATLDRLHERFLSREDFASSLLCLDHVFSESTFPSDFSPLSLSALATALRTFLNYTRLLQRLAFCPRPTNDPATCKLFQLHFRTEDVVIIPPAATALTQSCRANLLLADQGYHLDRWEVDLLINSVFRRRLLTQVTKENGVCEGIKHLRPCLTFAASSKCTREGCPQYHGDTQYYTAESYNMRVRVILLQMLICRTVNALESFPDQIKRKRYVRDLSLCISFS